MKAVVVIPARMQATRFPGKPLADICGKPMLQWVYERAAMADGVERVMVATCDEEIIRAVEAFGGSAVMTSDTHRSGTDRIAEAAANVEADVIINVQGDEPLIEPASIELALKPFGEENPPDMSSLMYAVDDESAQDPNLVKVVVSIDNFALYFSRSVIPYRRNALEGRSTYGHVGLYAYRKDFLLKYALLPCTPLEKAESLEQLRALEYGYRIKMVEIESRPIGVDTVEDLERVCELLRAG